MKELYAIQYGEAFGEKSIQKHTQNQDQAAADKSCCVNLANFRNKNPFFRIIQRFKFITLKCICPEMKRSILLLYVIK